MTAPPGGERRRGTPESFEYYFEGPRHARRGQASFPRRGRDRARAGRPRGDAGDAGSNAEACVPAARQPDGDRSRSQDLPGRQPPDDASLSRGGGPSSIDAARAGAAAQAHGARPPRWGDRSSIPCRTCARATSAPYATGGEHSFTETATTSARRRPEPSSATSTSRSAPFEPRRPLSAPTAENRMATHVLRIALVRSVDDAWVSRTHPGRRGRG